MTIFLLLLIVAILLFGSSAVIGVIGKILGTLLAVAALVWAATSFSISPELLAMTALAVVVALGVVNYILEQMRKTGTPEPRAVTPSASSSPAYREHAADIEANRRFRDRYLSGSKDSSS
jgi:hypothetical protein